MISEADWQRMPWHARQRYIDRQRARVSRVPRQIVPTESPRMLSERGIRRCGICGGWSFMTCSLHPDD